MCFLKLKQFSRLVMVASLCALSLSSIGCTSNGNHKPVPAINSKSDEKSMAQECQRVAHEGTRLRNGAVSAYNSGRPDAALTLFDESIEFWRQITNGALRCDQDTVTYANERLSQTKHERDEIGRQIR